MSAPIEPSRKYFGNPIAGLVAILVTMGCAVDAVSTTSNAITAFRAWSTAPGVTPQMVSASLPTYAWDSMVGLLPTVFIALLYLSAWVVGWLDGNRRWRVPGLVLLALTTCLSGNEGGCP